MLVYLTFFKYLGKHATLQKQISASRFKFPVPLIVDNNKVRTMEIRGLFYNV